MPRVVTIKSTKTNVCNLSRPTSRILLFVIRILVEFVQIYFCSFFKKIGPRHHFNLLIVYTYYCVRVQQTARCADQIKKSVAVVTSFLPRSKYSDRLLYLNVSKTNETNQYQLSPALLPQGKPVRRHATHTHTHKTRVSR